MTPLSRAALLALAALGLGCAQARSLEPRAPATQSPNIVVVLVDDLRFDALGTNGHPFVETPNVDRLAREGANFSRAFVTTSLCCPSRASLLTGAWAHRHGVTSNERIDLDPALPTFPKLLQASGWHTAFIGKWHIGESAEPRPGFDRWVSFEGQGVYFDPVLNEDGRAVEAQGYVTDLLTDAAVRWIDEQRADRPFCLILSHKATHAPMAPAPRHRGRYGDREITAPLSAADDLEDKPEALRRMAAHGFLKRQFEASGDQPAPERVPPPDWDIPDFVRLFLETLLAVDESVGRVVAALEERGLLERTLVVFTSDNGFLFGEHQAPDKRLAFEESIRVPLILRAPGLALPGSVIDELVLNVDLAPTLLELAGIDPPSLVQGRSLLPLLRGERGAWRDSFLYEYFREHQFEGIPTTLALRGKDWKYVVYPDYLAPNEELYDLKADPFEMRNLAELPENAARMAELRGLLERSKQETGFRVPLQAAPPAFEAEERELLSLDLAQTSNTTAEVDLAGLAFRLRVELESAEPDGVLASYGGPAGGFTLSLEGGRAVFALHSAGRKRRVASDASIPARQIAVEAGLDLGGRLFLRFEGGPEKRSTLWIEPLPALPRPALVLGELLGGSASRLEIVALGRRL